VLLLLCGCVPLTIGCMQVKVWAPDGSIITGSGHHHGAVECLIATLQGSGVWRYWSGSSDGTIFAWADESGTGRIDEAAGKVLKSEAQKGT
jgi:hypothetical protein